MAAANDLETEYMRKYNSKDPSVGYNIKDGGSHGSHHEETKKQISETQIKKYAAMTQEQRDQKAAPISGWWEGKEREPHTEEWKQKNSEMMKEWHSNNEHPRLGDHHTEEAKSAMSKKMTGRKRTPEAIAKVVQKLQRNQDKEESVIKLYKDGIIIGDMETKLDLNRSAIYRILKRNNIDTTKRGNKGKRKKLSPETKAKQSQSAKERWIKIKQS